MAKSLTNDILNVNYLEVSAKNGKNVPEAFKKICTSLKRNPEPFYLGWWWKWSLVRLIGLLIISLQENV